MRSRLFLPAIALMLTFSPALASEAPAAVVQVRAERTITIDGVLNGPEINAFVRQLRDGKFINSLPWDTTLVREIDPYLSSGNLTQIQVAAVAALPQNSPVAGQIADAVCKAVVDRLDAVIQQQRDNWAKELAGSLAEEKQDQQALDAKQREGDTVNSGLKELSDSLGLADVTPESVGNLSVSLAGSIEAAEVDQTGKSARQTALAQAISKLQGKVNDKLQNDPIVRQLQVAVDAQQKKLEQLERQSLTGSVAQAEVDDSREHLAEAKAMLLQRQETAAQAAGGDTIQKWNDDLLSLTVDLAELDARIAALRDTVHRLKTLSEVMLKSAELEATKSQLKVTLSQLRNNMATLRELLAAKPPKVSISNGWT